MIHTYKIPLACLLLCITSGLMAQETPPFRLLEEFGQQKPWSHEQFANDPQAFQFAIVSDRTGGHRPGIFEKAVHKLNLLQPEFVMSVGDFIEGYTKDEKIIEEEWNEFNGFIEKLEAPFFYLPGNHDISNEVMREAWKERFGKSYYAFLYQDVLFICMDTNDGDGVTLSEAQISYVKNVLQENTDVRWTMLFMHHPIWDYEDLSGFQDIEALLQNRDYSVIAGHRHRYLYEERYDKNYITLGTTGGGSQLRGASFGEFDHVVWVTMTKENGPVIVNVALDGIIEKDIVTIQGRALASALLEAADMPSEVLLDEKASQTGRASLLVANPTDVPMLLSASLLHHHQLQADKSQWEVTIAPKSSEEISFHFQPTASEELAEKADPLLLHWALSYQVDSLKNMVLQGQKLLEAEAFSELKMEPEQSKFLEPLDLSFTYPFAEAEIRYTLDGSTPDANSALYAEALPIEQSTNIQARIMRDGLAGPVHSMQFEKVKAVKSQKVARAKKGLQFQYYEGEWKKLPDFDALKAVKSGVATDLDVEKIAGEREDHFAIQYSGYVKVAEEGMYTFSLRSDDGARLIIAGQNVIENDGSHSTSREEGQIALKAGYHPIEIQYFEDFLGETLEIQCKPIHQENMTEITDMLYHE
ncbi:PA14 domain-containing protein [Catalinimonas niigatensis]|uniref:PA14 domain-containing protein n=1 Tax=Catalinimonas niigatensis TaxID=1397264 RepID=UPI0026671892|nr:PA14 domain-containing protein [Catalinimonas niigatensis]WPP49190.1 PA14 domain-containing protein [Catalinimonas niigatensis]